MGEEVKSQHSEILARVIDALKDLDADDRERIIKTVTTFFGIQASPPAVREPEAPARQTTVSPGTAAVRFSEDLSMSPKEFLLEKQPHTDVERAACLAYYLTHYRDSPKFKTLDLSKLNAEAAQPKFANAAWVSNNAVKRGYLIQAAGGMKQISAAGELFVRALPDRESARKAMAKALGRKRSRRRPKPEPEED